jgi:hypothetical protein
MIRSDAVVLLSFFRLFVAESSSSSIVIVEEKRTVMSESVSKFEIRSFNGHEQKTPRFRFNRHNGDGLLSPSFIRGVSPLLVLETNSLHTQDSSSDTTFISIPTLASLANKYLIIMGCASSTEVSSISFVKHRISSESRRRSEFRQTTLWLS